MFKERFFPAGHDFKTGILCKLCLFFGIIFLSLFIFLKIFSVVLTSDSSGFSLELYNISTSTVPDSLGAFATIFIGVGIILYFFQCQFAKLAAIADEIENSEELE